MVTIKSPFYKILIYTKILIYKKSLLNSKEKTANLAPNFN